MASLPYIKDDERNFFQLRFLDGLQVNGVKLSLLFDSVLNYGRTMPRNQQRHPLLRHDDGLFEAQNICVLWFKQGGATARESMKLLSDHFDKQLN